MAAVSKPSSSTMKKHSAKITHWKGENGCSVSRVWTLTSEALGFMVCLWVIHRGWFPPSLNRAGVGSEADGGRPGAQFVLALILDRAGRPCQRPPTLAGISN